MDGADRAIDALNKRARALAAAVVEAIGERFVESVFVGGSVARGDVAWFESDELEIYSDLDLYVVVTDGIDPASARAAARRAASLLTGPDGVRFLRPDDVGVYTRDDLWSQPARPGTVGLAVDHRVLYGDSSIPGQLAGRIGNSIDVTEGLYLIENRLLELDLARPEPPDPAGRRLLRYMLIKSTLDVAAAFLISRGRYAMGVAERRAIVEVLGATGGFPAGWDQEVVACAFDGLADLRAELSRRVEPGIHERVCTLGVAVWAAIAADLFGGAVTGLPAMVLMRCQAGSYMSNLRQFVAMGARLGRPRLWMLGSGLGLTRYAPVPALRLYALAARVSARGDLDAAGTRSIERLLGYLDRLTAACGYAQGSLAGRVREMYAAAA